MKWTVLGRNRNAVAGANISESINDKNNTRRYIATIRGWRNFKIGKGDLATGEIIYQDVVDAVRWLRDRIDNNDETVFEEPESGWYLDEYKKQETR